MPVEGTPLSMSVCRFQPLAKYICPIDNKSFVDDNNRVCVGTLVNRPHPLGGNLFRRDRKQELVVQFCCVRSWIGTEVIYATALADPWVLGSGVHNHQLV